LLAIERKMQDDFDNADGVGLPLPWQNRAMRRGDAEGRSLRVRLLLPLSVVLGVIGAGTLGYRWLWRDVGGSWLDALFMTVTTITTIGYGEVKPLTGAGRVFTMIIAFVGIGSLFYTFSVVMESLVARRLTDPAGRRKMARTIEALSGHIIVAGLGRVGRQAVQELHEAGTPFIIVDPGEVAVRAATELGYLLVQGDATEDSVLQRAGIQRARGLIVTTANDATNMYIVLSARVLNSTLNIVSRAVDDASVAKLIRAGANRAISPYAIGGHRLAHLILSPAVVDFFETAMRRGDEALNIEDMELKADSRMVGKTLDDFEIRKATGVTVLAILRDGTPVVNPPGDYVLQSADHLLALGTRDQLARLERVVTLGHGP
jgi:voltage-gated potassium channel